VNVDGSVYEGQWRNDLCNGLGYYKHYTGYTYDGVFENGLPANMATQFSIALDGCPFDKTNRVFELIEGGEASEFKVTVKSISDEGEVFMEDDRRVQIMLAIRIDVADKSQYENQTTTELYEDLILKSYF
jgi:hypothetical protein